MKVFYSIFSVLLLVPLVLARLPTSIRSKVIYHQGYFLAETRDGFFDFQSHPGYSAYFTFPRESVSIDLFRSRKDPKLASLVVETLGTPWPKNESQNCMFQCSKSITVVTSCRGNARAREMTEEERHQIQAFIDDHQGTKKDLQVIFDKGYISSRAFKGERIILNGSPPYNSYAFINGIMTESKTVYAVLFPHGDKSFVLESADEKYNFSAPSPIEGLKVQSLWDSDDRAYFQVRPMTDKERP